MKTALRTAPHYFVIDSIGGMNEGYSDTTCRRIEDVKAPELAKAMVEEYIDQWTHDHLEYYTERIENYSLHTEIDLNGLKETYRYHAVRYDIEECPHGGWVKLTPEFSDDIDSEYIDDWGFHTLFIQVYDGIMLGDGVVVYDQMDDMVTTITHKHTAMRIAEETISIGVERMKYGMYHDQKQEYDLKYIMNNLFYAYDTLAEVVRDLEYPQDVMVDIDDTCTHFFPVQAMKQMVYTNDNRITTL